MGDIWPGSPPVAWRPTRRMHGATLAFAIALVVLAVSLDGLRAGESAAADARIGTPLLPGLGAHDPRGRLDPDKVPWCAVGKLQIASLNLRRFCTGTLVGPSTVLTAAHCVLNPLTRRNFPPGSLHFLIGYDGSRYVGHGEGVKLEIGPASATAGRPRRSAAIGC
jgi:protease YdgD